MGKVDFLSFGKLEIMTTIERSHKLQQIYFLSNPYSPHVRHWEDVLKLGGYSVVIFTAHPIKSKKLVSSPVKEIIPRTVIYFPMFWRYFVTGLMLRFKANEHGFKFFHAHNTSGYGLMALLSGKPYIITTYGSEIFSAQDKGPIYCFLIRTILQNSIAVTSTSSKMTEYLNRHFGVGKSKIHEFSLGVSTVFFFDAEGRNTVRSNLSLNSSPVWIVNRRIRPLYHTVELLKAFIKFRERANKGSLIVLEGDSDQTYLAEVESLCAGIDYIKLIHGFMPQSELRAYLSAADFSISVPESDQLSSSILEGAVCGAVPLLANLESYAPLKNRGIFFTINDVNDSCSYEQIFYRSSEMMENQEYDPLLTNMHNSLNKFEMHTVLKYVDKLYRRFLH